MDDMKKVSRAGHIFDTITDIGCLFLAVLYIFYITLLLIFQIGTMWLNYCMLGVTLVYILFFVVKIFSLNRIIATKKAKRYTRLILKYSKWAMKLINALFVIFSIATTSLSGNHIIPMLGIFIVGFTFLLSLLWDIVCFIVRKKVNELRTDWGGLSVQQKNKRIEVIIGSLVKNIDSITGLELADTVKLNASQIVKQQNQKEPQNTEQDGGTNKIS